ncbi:hypothetical protein [Campylobacter fetus]|uniref:hypothetical protein n=2 Tax=Campylobacter fetus TaxID=196 RepID=UPI00138E49B0|nr:hypothetical protein [Campylobacter fetus]
MLAYFLNGNDKDFVSSIISAKEAKELIDNAIKLLQNAPLDKYTKERLTQLEAAKEQLNLKVQELETSVQQLIAKDGELSAKIDNLDLTISPEELAELEDYLKNPPILNSIPAHESFYVQGYCSSNSYVNWTNFKLWDLEGREYKIKHYEAARYFPAKYVKTQKTVLSTNFTGEATLINLNDYKVTGDELIVVMTCVPPYATGDPIDATKELPGLYANGGWNGVCWYIIDEAAKPPVSKFTYTSNRGGTTNYAGYYKKGCLNYETWDAVSDLAVSLLNATPYTGTIELSKPLPKFVKGKK